MSVRRPAFKWAGAFCGVALMTSLFWPVRDLFLEGLNDFPAFYTAGSLVGTHDFYNREAFMAREASAVGASNQNIQFVRLPFCAAFFWPFSRLPYLPAYWIWQTTCLLALVGFVLLWPHGSVLFPLLCFLPPVAASFVNAQDVPFVLLWIALAVRLANNGRGFAAGLILSLCLAKPHFFILAPFALMAARQWMVVMGAVCGSVALLGVSFAIAGPGWPPQLLSVWGDPLVHHNLTISSPMAFLAAQLGAPPLRLALLIVVPSLCAVATYMVGRKCDLATALSLAVALGVFSAFHVYWQDYCLLLPLAAILLHHYLPFLTPRDDAA